LKFSIIIPAHNEENYITTCLESIRNASRNYKNDVEIIVVLNRCTDKTEAIALKYSTKIIRDNSKNLSKIRNSGAKQASGDILITIDSDSWMSENMLEKIDKALQTKKYIGGGVPIKPERYSMGIIVTLLFVCSAIKLLGIAGGLYWCYRKDFERIGGFNEDLLIGEDLDFAQRLKVYGRRNKLRFITLRKVYIKTSMRKLDKFGDWYLFTSMLSFIKHIKALKHGNYNKEHLKFADKYFYDFSNKDKYK
jgi:glycosyltransferase involved in cell wall biosynthesis